MQVRSATVQKRERERVSDCGWHRRRKLRRTSIGQDVWGVAELDTSLLEGGKGDVVVSDRPFEERGRRGVRAQREDG